MRNRAVKIGVLCGLITALITSLMTVVIELPGRRTEQVVYVITIMLTNVLLTTPGPSTKRLAQIWYAQGVHDTLQRVQPDGGYAEAPSPAAEPGKVIRIHHRRGRVALVGSALLSIAVALIVIAAMAVWPSGYGRTLAAPTSQVILRDSAVQSILGAPVPAVKRAAQTMENAAALRSRNAQASPHRLGLIPASVRMSTSVARTTIRPLATTMHLSAPTSPKRGRLVSRLLSIGLK